MNTKLFFKSLLLSFFCFAIGNAQEILTLENAVKIALDNNYDIKIADNNLKIDKTNVAIGNAGMLPSISAVATDNNSILNTSQTRSDGTTVELQNAKNNSLNYGVALDWTIFDGLKMFAKYDQLKELQNMSDAQLKMTIIDKVSSVNSVYYDLIQEQQKLSDLDSTIIISQKRLEFTKNRYTIGKGSKLDVLNAQVDLNTDLGNLLKEKQTYANAKTLLNQILARDLNTDFKVSEGINVDRNLKLVDLIVLAEKQNPELAMQIINKKVTELQLKQIKGERYPIVKLNTGYNFNDTKSSLGFTTESSAHGLNYGFSASLNLFDGDAQNRNEKIAKMQIDNSKLVIDQQLIQLRSNLTVAFQVYLTNLDLIDLEENNTAISKQNLEITAEKFKIGTITSVEFRAAQLNYINSRIRLSNAQFQAKLSEITLRELAGNLNF
ncbi:TolC family protein [Flavobacterium granuli]|uniref:Outer membrane protein TolC n=1 Tax=Flavobacterium granuli TaxID=280093 RepID=A0ABU1RZQ4_9FLAO|nr:TolC family protein [Flavobacterium granuli]MDR6844268.1 outer membrane protein TolC [Flavobacterium granuli]